MIVNFIYCLIGEVVTLLFMYFGYKWFNRSTTSDTSDQLAKDNRAVGLVVMGIFVGIGVAIGLVIGLGLN